MHSVCIYSTNGMTSVSLNRFTVQDVTLSNGVVIPARTMINAAATVTHMDENLYKDPTVFNPWRFSDIRSQDEQESFKNQFVSPTTEYIPFGFGRHAW